MRPSSPIFLDRDVKMILSLVTKTFVTTMNVEYYTGSSYDSY